MGRQAAGFRVLILDFDGVVIDSNAAKKEAFREVFEGFPEHSEPMMAYHDAHVSASRFEKFDYLLTRLGRPGDAELRARIAEDFATRVAARLANVPFVRGAEAFLAEMTQRVPIYLASVTPAEELGRIVAERGLSGWFRGVYGCPPWTKPRAILDILTREGATAGEALLIGDSAGDQRAAGATGVEFLAVESGLPFDEPLPRRFPDLTEIPAYLEDRLP